MTDHTAGDIPLPPYPTIIPPPPLLHVSPVTHEDGQQPDSTFHKPPNCTDLKQQSNPPSTAHVSSSPSEDFSRLGTIKPELPSYTSFPQKSKSPIICSKRNSASRRCIKWLSRFIIKFGFETLFIGGAVAQFTILHMCKPEDWWHQTDFLKSFAYTYLVMASILAAIQCFRWRVLFTPAYMLDEEYEPGEEQNWKRPMRELGKVDWVVFRARLYLVIVFAVFAVAIGWIDWIADQNSDYEEFCADPRKTFLEKHDKDCLGYHK